MHSENEGDGYIDCILLSHSSLISLIVFAVLGMASGVH